MKMIRNFFYLIGQGFVGVFRNSIMSTASVLILVCCMLIIGTFSLVISGLNQSLEQVKDLNVIMAYISASADEKEISDMQKSISEYSAGVTCVFVSKEEALERLREDFGDDVYLAPYFEPSGEEEESGVTHATRANPLPDSFEITFENEVQAEALNNFVCNLKIEVMNPNGVRETVPGITDTRHRIGLVEKFSNARKGLIVLAGLLMAVLLVVSLFVIMNTVRLGMFARREEIAVMRYVGATKTFVVMPFIVEGIIIGLTAAVLAFIVQYYLYTYVITDIALNYGLGTLAPFGGFAKYIAAAFLGVGLFAGVIASGISVKRYLNA